MEYNLIVGIYYKYICFKFGKPGEIQRRKAIGPKHGSQLLSIEISLAFSFFWFDTPVLINSIISEHNGITFGKTGEIQ
jgi:hypothetical protein